MTSVLCTFSEITEQTIKDFVQTPASTASEAIMDMTATFDQNSSLSVTTRGGQEFCVNTRLPLIDVFPLEDGLLLKCKFKQELPPQFQSGPHDHQHESYCYMTLTGHPLNDIYPLSIAQLNEQVSTPLIGTKLELLWVSELIPLAIAYDQELQMVSFALVHSNDQASDDLKSERSPYTNNMAQKSTHILKVVDKRLFSQKPSKCVVTQGASCDEICISLFQEKEKAVYMFKSDFSLKNFRPTTIADVQSISYINFLKFSDDQIVQLVKPEICESLHPKGMFESPQTTKEMKYFRKCVQKLSTEFVTLNEQGDTLSVYYGGSNLIYKMTLAEVTKTNLPALRLLSTKNKSTKRIIFSNGAQFDLQLEAEIPDAVVSSIFQLIRSSFSDKDQIAFLKRLVTFYTQHGGSQFNQFIGNFTDLVCGKPTVQSDSSSPTKKVSKAGQQSSPVKSPVKKLITTSSPTKASSPLKKQPLTFARQNTAPQQPAPSKTPFQQMLDMRNNTSAPQPQQRSSSKEMRINQTKMALLRDLFKQMHLMYVDLQLVRYSSHLEPLRKLLCHLANVLNLPGYTAFYNQTRAASKKAEEPICFNHWIDSKLGFEFPVMFERTRVIVRLYEIMNLQRFQRSRLILSTQPDNSFLQQDSPTSFFQGQRTSLLMPKSAEDVYQSRTIEQYLMNESTQLHLYERVLFVMNEERFGLEQIDSLPYHVQLPIHEILRYTRSHLNEIKTSDWSINIYKLIQREDIINNLKQTTSETGQKKAPKFYSGKENKLSMLKRSKFVSDFDFNKEKQQNSSDNQFVDELIGGSTQDLEVQNQDEIGDMPSYVKASHNDTRQQEVEFLLRSDVQMKISTPQQSDLTEEDRVARQKLLLEKMFRRQLSKCIGRGALTLGTEESLPTQKLDIPKICHQAFIAISVQNQLDESELRPNAPNTLMVENKTKEERDTMQWAEFHNGVAAALRIAQSSFQQSAIKNTRNWIMYHRPSHPKNEHGGFLLGLGLLGQLDSLQPTDVYQHLKTAHDSTTIGILLGRAASQIGKMDESDSRMMCLHIPALLPHTLSVDYSLAVQSAAVVGAGLLYQSTSNRSITEMLLSQICKKPNSDKLTEREGYAFASGLALGMVNLGAGKQTKGQTPTALLFKELDLEQRLIRFVEGGKAMPLPRSMLSQIQLNDNFKSSAIKENDMVNTTITAPGALVALALIYLKSNNKQVADRIKIPHTFEAMDNVTPHSLVLKILTKNLILWDQIECSPEWIDSQIPDIIKTIFYAQSQLELNQKLQTRINEADIDYATVALCVANIKAASVLSLGFRYAGTNDKKAKTLILDVLNWFRKKIQVVPSVQPLGSADQTNLKFQNKNLMDKNTTDSSLCICALALSMVMAGSCDIECFRALRVLRKRFEQDMNFGYNQAIFLAFGMLFLSNGQFTFSRSDKAIAGLLSAVYPIFPTSAQDNRYHLQALRHFYVFALETRLLQAKDIDTGLFVNIEVDVEILSGDSKKTIQIKTPEIINGQIISASVKNNSQFHDLCLNVVDDPQMMQVDQAQNLPSLNGGEFKKTDFQQIIYVKRKQQSNLNLNSEQLSLRQMLSSQLTQDEIDKQSEKAEECLSKVKDTSIKEFLQTFCTPRDPTEILTDLFIQDNSKDLFSVPSKVQNVIDQNKTSIQQMTLLQLHECYTRDQIDSLPLLLTSLQAKEPLQSSIQTPDSLFPGGESQPHFSDLNKDLANLVLDELEKLGDKETVQKFKSCAKSGAPIPESMLEIYHALEMCGIQFSSDGTAPAL